MLNSAALNYNAALAGSLSALVSRDRVFASSIDGAACSNGDTLTSIDNIVVRFACARVQ
jgi:hypothetical protein